MMMMAMREERWSHLTGFKLHSITTSLPCKGKSNQHVRHILSLTSSSRFPISFPHPLTPSPHPLTSPPPPTYVLASLPKEHVLPVHCIHCEGSPHRCQLHQSEEKHFCLQHAMYTSTNALSPCFSPGTAQYVGGGGGYLIVHSLSPSSTYKVSASGCFHALRILPILKSRRETSTAFSLPPPPPPPGEPSP